MAFDKSPPRNGIIFFFTVVTVVTLVALEFVLSSYYEAEVARARRNAAAPSYELSALRRAAEQEFKAGPVTLDRAISAFASSPRESFPEVQPQASSDVDPLKGWVGKESCGPDGRCPKSFRRPLTAPVDIVAGPDDADHAKGASSASEVRPTDGLKRKR